MFFMFKNKVKGEIKMLITNEILLLFLIAILFINQIVIILEKEKLESKITVILKILHKKPLTKKETEYVRKFR